MSKNQAIYGMWADKSDDEVNKLREFIELFPYYYLILQIYDFHRQNRQFLDGSELL